MSNVVLEKPLIEGADYANIISINIPQGTKESDIEKGIRAALLCNLCPAELELGVSYYMRMISTKMIEDGNNTLEMNINLLREELAHSSNIEQ